MVLPISTLAKFRESQARLYLLVPAGGTGTRTTPGHFPLPVLLPDTRPEASRLVPVTDPDEPFVAWLPAERPEASRKSVRWPLVPLVRVVALPATRPLPSR